MKKHNKQFQCELCGSTFASFTEAIDHVKDSHDESEKMKSNCDSDVDDLDVNPALDDCSSSDEMSSGDEERSSSERSSEDEDDDLYGDKNTKKPFVRDSSKLYLANISSDPPEMNRARQIFGKYAAQLGRLQIEKKTTEWTKSL